MKKVFLLLITAIVVLSGCEFNTTKIFDGAEMFSDEITARAGDWKTSGVSGDQGCYVYQEFEFKEINRDVLKRGAVLVYLIDANNRDNQLPYVHSFESGRDIVTENIRFEVERGLLTLVVTWDDFKLYDIDENLKFKVCIIYPSEED